MILVVLFVWFIIELTNTVCILLVFLLFSMGDALWGKQQQNKENWLWFWWSHSWANRPNFLLKRNTVLYCLVWHKLFWFKNLIMLMHICSLTLCDYLSSASTGLHCMRLRTNTIICMLVSIHSLTAMDAHFCCGREYTSMLVVFCEMFCFSHRGWSTNDNSGGHWLQSVVAFRGAGCSQWYTGSIYGSWLQSVTLRGIGFSQWYWGALA